MAVRPLTEVMDYPDNTCLRAFENMVRERLANHRRITTVDAHMLLDGRRSRWSPAMDRRTGALLTLFGYVDPGDGVYERRVAFPEEEPKRRRD